MEQTGKNGKGEMKSNNGFYENNQVLSSRGLYSILVNFSQEKYPQDLQNCKNLLYLDITDLFSSKHLKETNIFTLF